MGLSSSRLWPSVLPVNFAPFGEFPLNCGWPTSLSLSSPTLAKFDCMWGSFLSSGADLSLKSPYTRNGFFHYGQRYWQIHASLMMWRAFKFREWQRQLTKETFQKVFVTILICKLCLYLYPKTQRAAAKRCLFWMEEYKSLEYSPSRQADGRSAGREIPRLLLNVEVHIRVHKSPPLVLSLSQINPIDSFPLYSCNIRSYITSQLHLRLPLGLFPLGF